MSDPTSLSQRLSKGFGRLGWGPLLLWAAVAALFIGLTIHYTRTERFFYFWDNFAYHRAVLESLTALQQPDTSWLHYLRLSMQSGFSQLFTITLAPLMAALGEGRPVFISGIVGFYLLPCAGFGTLIVNRIVPLHRWQWPLVFTACATLPVLWRASLSGYPDIGGLAIALGSLLLLTSDLGYKKWLTAIGMGALLAGIFLFRRHLVYCIIPLMAAVSGLSPAYCLHEGGPRRWWLALGALLRIGCTTALTVFFIWLVAPNYFLELISNNYRELYLPYQATVHDAFRQHRDYIGLFYWGLGSLGLSWGLIRGGQARWICALLLIYVAISSCIWLFYLRYLGVQYNLHFAIIIAVAIGLLVAFMSEHPRRRPAGLALTLILGALWLDRLAFLPFSPQAVDWALPARLPPMRNPDYDEIKRLIVFLHGRVTAPHNKILVAASSQTMNSDMLTNGEKSIYGSAQSRLAIMNGSHVDTVQPYPLRDMVAADLILVATPFQHHLRVEDQGVVLAISNAVLETSLFAKDFQKVDFGFSLTKGVELTVYARVAPTSYLTQVDTARQLFDTVGVSDAWTGPFMVGEAATGAEYYDARLIVPQSDGRFLLDLTQVRLKADQAAITLFVRTTESGPKHIRGDIRGIGLDVTAELFSDQSPSKPTWQSTHSWSEGTDIDLAYPSIDQGILALTLVPKSKPPLGTPLGLRIDNFRISGN